MTVSARAGSSSAPDKTFICAHEGCGKTYNRASKLAQHIRSHTGERPFLCDQAGCGASYMRNEHLKAHQRQHLDSSQKTFKCGEEGCELAFWTSSQLKNHSKACHTEDGNIQDSHPCTEPQCFQSFHKRKNLRLHIRQAHSGGASPSAEGPAELPFACTHPGCELRFDSPSRRKSHYKSHHTNRYNCAMQHDGPQEGANAENGDTSQVYVFPTWSALQAHIKAAHAHICPWPGCGKQFSRQDSVRGHFRRHEARKLRLELETRLTEMSQEAKLNHLRAGFSDDSDASDYESADVDRNTSDPDYSEVRNWPDTPTQSSHSQPKASPLSEAELTHQAAELYKKRPKRGGIFKDLHTRTLSSASTASASDDGTSIARSSTSATGVTASGLEALVPCSWNGCPKTYSSSRAMSVHLRTTHLGEKPFECVGCGKHFAHKHLVTRHHRICPSKDDVGAKAKGSRLRFSLNAANDEEILEPKTDVLPATPNLPQQSDIKSRLIDLLTGAGYTAITTSRIQGNLKRSLSEDDDPASSIPKRRAVNDRIFDCPWSSINAEITGEEAKDSAVTCDYHFKRLYDVRRHLQAHHGLELVDDEIRAWFALRENKGNNLQSTC